jgi:hypothetical protein
MSRQTKYSTDQFYCPDLENDCKLLKPTKEKSYCAELNTSGDINAYIESHPLNGCILAEVLVHPENVKLIETRHYKTQGIFEKYEYRNNPKIQCGVNCPFPDCRASEPEYLGHISRHRIQILAQEVVGARLI